MRTPTASQLGAIGTELGMSLTEADIGFFLPFLEQVCSTYDQLQACPDTLPPVKYPRTPGYFPSVSENPHNAWYVKTDIKGAPEGRLAGRRVAVKDNICVAGVPMMNGALAMEGYVPEVDATVVTRILDAGGTIAGKAHCEYYCYSAFSFTNAKGYIQNPFKSGYSAGGSSSGSAAVVAAKDVEMALGCDQGGSIRIPAALCGVYGMKPTHGLVPYTGIIGVDPVIDHCGPITNTVFDNALLLEVLAGPDGLDPRQAKRRAADYTRALTGDIKGLRIGLMTEGFEQPGADPEIGKTVRAAASKLSDLGALVREISIPGHAFAQAIFAPLAFEGAVAIMMEGSGYPPGMGGLCVPSLFKAQSAWRDRADEMPDTAKLGLLAGAYFRKHHGGRFYGKARNLRASAIAIYDSALDKFDLLLMPTVPVKTAPLPSSDSPRDYALLRSFEVLANTAQFDATGHPAMSIPCGMVDELPVGMMLIGRYFDEAAIYRCAHAFEQAVDWQRL